MANKNLLPTIIGTETTILAAEGGKYEVSRSFNIKRISRDLFIVKTIDTEEETSIPADVIEEFENIGFEIDQALELLTYVIENCSDKTNMELVNPSNILKVAKAIMLNETTSISPEFLIVAFEALQRSEALSLLNCKGKLKTIRYFMYLIADEIEEY